MSSATSLNDELSISGSRLYICQNREGPTNITCKTADVKYDPDDVEYDPDDVEYDTDDVEYDSDDVEYDSDDVESFTTTCSNGPCQNGATCSVDNNQHVCNCLAGYEGTYCQTASCSNTPCQNGATCTVVSNKVECECATGYKGTYCQTKVATLPLPFGAANNHVQLSYPNRKDWCHEVTEFDCPVKIDDSYRNKLYICENGIVTFFEKTNINSVPTGAKMQKFKQSVVVAPYFSNIDARTSGYIGYKILNGTEVSNDNDVNTAVTAILTDAGYSTMNVFFLLVVTWQNVIEYQQNNADTSTFQLIIVSDGMDTTLAFFAYLEDQMNFATNENLIGFAFTNQQSLDLRVSDPVANYTNFGRSGFAMYSLNTGSDTIISDCFKCKQWTAQQANTFADLESKWTLMPQCPCDKNTIPSTGYFQELSSSSSAVYIYSVHSAQKYNFQGSMCSYAGNSYISTGSNVGFRTKYNNLTSGSIAFFEAELNMKETCCNADLCDAYYSVRPKNVNCSSQSNVLIGGGTGDPHITTPDGKSFTFNGEGEYTMLSVVTDGVDFTLQGRTAPYLDDEGKSVGATIFTAFAARDKADDSRCIIELDYETGMRIKVNGISYNSAFASKGFQASEKTVSLEKNNNTIKVSFVNSGISFNVAVKLQKLLTIAVIVPELYKDLSKGLLGNTNADPSDDLKYPNGTILSTNATEREVFDYGQSWIISSSDDSIFEYPPGGSYLNYQNLNPVVNFLDEANQTLVEDAKVLCGQDNIPCIFDKVFTGSDEVAEDTKTVIKEQEDTKQILENVAPTLTLDVTSLNQETGKLHVDKNKETTVVVTGDDDGTISFSIISGENVATLSQGSSDNARDLKIIFTSSTPQTISLTVTDNLGVQSPLLVLGVVLCTGCNGNGQCDNTITRTLVQATEGFSLAQCICDEYHDGDECENDLNGCSGDPCSLGRDCTDNDVNTHMSSGKAFTCADCPAGYTTEDEDCIDVNECDLPTKVCSDICDNTIGSYICKCSNGRRASNATHCIDINECDEATSNCQQVCENTDPGFTCSCLDGYNYDSESNTCTLSDESRCSSSGCSTENGGCIVENEETKCFCNKGYKLGEDDKTCEDINECDQNICSGTCSNTDGSYTCGCYPGYILNSDRTTCSACPLGSWGDNCGQECSCSSLGSSGCDNVKGCVCKIGWEGTKCSEDVNECQDVSICNSDYKECANTQGSYRCDCVDGYELNSDTNECDDYNECQDDSLNKCEQKCVNTPGGSYCDCNVGYTKNATDKTKCVDVNECDIGNTGCEQTCENAIGSYNCLCYFGYSLNSDQKTCSQLSADTICSNEGLNCSGYCEVGTATAKCACPSGFVLAADDLQSCLDVNECEDTNLNKCEYPETCKNVAGGFTCTCPTGQFLDRDGITCTECDEFHYGENCLQECNCGVGSAHCDPVSGCVCKNGWTGEKCDTDKNECDAVTSPCTALNTICTNTRGGFTCNCLSGYFNNSNGQCEDTNECNNPQMNTCAQNCENTPGSYSCSCRDGFKESGNLCEDIDECAAINDCTQLCSNFEGSYKCSCEDGYTLSAEDQKTCTVQTECAENNTCGENTECLFLNGVESCPCKKGFEKPNAGDLLCTDIDECTPTNPCVDGTCENIDGGFTCSCSSGFKLDKDLITCIPCEPGTFGTACSQSCTCVESNTQSCSADAGVCTCKEGWEEDDCGTNIDECATNTYNCTGNSTCKDTNGSYVCECNAGFFKTSKGICKECDSKHYGKDCAEECKCIVTNTETCDSVSGSCTCSTGWEGDTCSDDINECSSSPCTDTHKTKCTNSPGSYTCECVPGFELNEEDQCVDTNECQRGTDNCDQVCTNTGGSFTCSCDIGYSGTDNDCEKCPVDKWGDQCANECDCDGDKSESCHHVTGCVCVAGWKGTYCKEDINECSTGTHTCVPNSDCTNTNGSHECACKPGYKETLGACKACDETHYGPDCSQICTCVEANTKLCDSDNGTCTCNNGWKGKNCSEDIDECTEGTDLCDEPYKTRCSNTDGSYLCLCDVGYELKNGDCTEIKECDGDPCENGATCIDLIDTYNCTCVAGYTGTNCETDINECESNPCQNGATCNNLLNSYTCMCADGYHGTDCETECENGMWGPSCGIQCSCDNETSTGCNHATGCVCKAGYDGINCTDINECTNGTHDCPENAICTNTPGSYSCACKPGYRGSLSGCEECTSNTYGDECSGQCRCVHNHTSLCDRVNGTCYCLPTWTGTRCETDIDECSLRTDNCNKTNEGCHNTNGGFVCSCNLGYKRADNGECVTDDSPVATTSATPDGNTKVDVVLTLFLTLSAGVDLNVDETYQEYKTEVHKALVNMYRRSLPVGTIFSIFIKNIRNGSLIAEYDVIVPTSAVPSVAVANAKLASSQETLQIFSENATASALTVNNVSVSTGGDNTDVFLCDVYEASIGNCERTCIVTDGKPYCESEAETDSLPLILGLAIGIPISFLCVAMIVLCIVYYNYRKEHRSSRDRSYEERDSDLFEGKMPVRMNTRMPSGPLSGHPDLMEYPEYTDYSTGSAQRYYDYSRSYDYDNGPERNTNFSWDYLFRQLGAGGAYKIKRPTVDAGPRRYEEN
ncbi:fibrillin-1-like [Mercenaria mercenaria]|uniref:fibrillin-1-like n=1 Tax=Mercenaria mercenaria TaxID=6596 RepID=UPI00234F13FC|nr:fibrillin-1-like [Mercenaria mercenaria]